MAHSELEPASFGCLYNNLYDLSPLICDLHKEDYLQIFKCLSFRLHSFCDYRECRDPVNRFNHTSCVAAVTPTVCLREQPFDFYGGGGAGRLRKKKISGSDFR